MVKDKKDLTLLKLNSEDTTSTGRTEIITKNTLRSCGYQHDEEANIWKPNEAVPTETTIEEAPEQAPQSSPNLTSTAHFQEEVWENSHYLELV
ncbi:hypothetical protein M9H77_18471 [Catharanthus roseus]|uniref:Uncharacterized protein n=1 Tax=Catharanthus roseus TaxID=4058 RepID=A0ACC0B7V2_CATRO|nr:hypothetical protein M9H77_18471 [Catharanthus roseus]